MWIGISTYEEVREANLRRRTLLSLRPPVLMHSCLVSDLADTRIGVIYGRVVRPSKLSAQHVCYVTCDTSYSYGECHV